MCFDSSTTRWWFPSAADMHAAQAGFEFFVSGKSVSTFDMNAEIGSRGASCWVVSSGARQAHQRRSQEVGMPMRSSQWVELENTSTT